MRVVVVLVVRAEGAVLVVCEVGDGRRWGEGGRLGGMGREGDGESTLCVGTTKTGHEGWFCCFGYYGVVAASGCHFVFILLLKGVLRWRCCDMR